MSVHNQPRGAELEQAANKAMQVTRIARTFWLTLAALTLTGCASMQCRFNASAADDSPIRTPHYVYPGTQMDARALAIPFWSSGDALYDGMVCMFYPAPLIDLPLSIVADTVFLPYDIFMVTIGGKTRYAKEIRPSVQQSVPAYDAQGAPSAEP